MAAPSSSSKADQKSTNDFSKLIVVSAAVHIGFFCLTAVQSQFFSRQELVFHEAIRVDLVALPDKLPDRMKPKPKLRPKPKKAKKKSKPNPNIARKKRALAEKRALNRLAAMSAIEKLNRELKQKKKRQKDKKPIKTVAEVQEDLEIKYKGQKITPGTSYKGLDKLRYDKYLAKLKIHIKSRWHLPQWLADAELKAKAIILVDETGYIVGKILSQSSGNALYDKKVMEALESASPLPKPPSRLSNQLKVDGIEVNFP